MSLSKNFVHLPDSGFELCYYGRLENEKLPLVFLHGAGGHGLFWEDQLEGLGAQFCCLAPDLPGHGHSKGAAAAEIERYREHVREFKETLGLPPLVLGGHSMGGAIAISYALAYPGDLKALILISTGGKLRVAPNLLETYRQGKQAPELVKHLYGRGAKKELVEKGKAELLKVPAAVSYADFTACDTFNALDRLQEIKIPALVLCGEEDVMTPPKFSTHLAEAIPHAEAKIFPGGGHMLMQEKPNEVNHAIAVFLEKIN